MEHGVKFRLRQLFAFLMPLILVTSLAGCSGTKNQNTVNNAATQITSEAETETSDSEEETMQEEGEAEAGQTETSESSDAQEEIDSTEETVTGGFHVDGTKLLDANGNEFVLRGVNHAHTWYREQDGVTLGAVAKTGSNCIRLVFSNGVQWTKDSADSLTRLINLCKQLNLIVIVEVHDGTGDDSIDTLEGIAQYWIEMKDVLIGNEAYVILNIANEWVGSWDSETWRDGYTQVIPEIREVGIENTIMVDAAGWGQYGKSIADYGQEVFDSDPLANTMFSIHMYGTSGKDESTIKENLEGVTDQNLCVCVGEFGYQHSDGDVDEAYLMQYCTEQNIGYLGWSWKGNGGGVEYLDIASSWDGSTLSADWGEVLINGEYGIKATSTICSVFE